MYLKGAALGALLVIPLFGCGSRVSSTTASERPRPGLQCHWADPDHRNGLVEKTVLGTGAKVYLHPEVLLTENDVESASVFPAEEGPAIALEFTAQGQEKMARLTAKSEGRLLAIVVDGVVITAPRISGPIAKRAKVFGTFSMAEAERLARRIHEKKRESGEQPYVSAEGGFRVRFPMTPTVEKLAVPAGESTVYKAELGGVSYAVLWLPVRLGPQDGAKAYLEDVAAAFAGQPFVLRTQVSAEITLDGQPGRELTAQTHVDEMRHRWYISRERLYQVSVMGPVETTNSEAANQFFASFGFNP